MCEEEVKNREIEKWLNISVFALYCWLLVWVIMLKFNSETVITDAVYHEGMSLWERMEYSKGYIPLYSLFASFKSPDGWVDHFLNFLLYIPMGVYLWIFFKDWKKTFAVIALSTLGFELVQLVTGLGGFDTTDLILNFLGGVLGYFVYTKIPIKNKERCLAVVDLCMIAVFLPLGIYAIVNTIRIFPLYLTLFY